MSTEENREIPDQEAESANEVEIVEERGISPARAIAGRLAIICLVISFIMTVFIFLLPPVGAFVCGILAALGIVLGIFRLTPWALKGFLGGAGLIAVIGGLAMYALGWSFGEPFYQAGVEALNSFTDPVEREIWPDHERSRVAQDSWATETEAEMGRDILQFFGTILTLFGLFLMAVNMLVGLVTGAARGRSRLGLGARIGTIILALGVILFFLGAVSEVIIAEALLLEQVSWRVVVNALLSGKFSFLFSLPADMFLMAMLAAVGSLGVAVLWLGATVLTMGGSLGRKIVFAVVAGGIALFVFAIAAVVAVVMLAVLAVAFLGGNFLGGSPAGSQANSEDDEDEDEDEEWVQTRFGWRRKKDLGGGIF